AIWDPQGLMNPGKVVDAHPLDSNLRLGVDFNPRDFPTHFSFIPDDNLASFSRAALRCVGIGQCRKTRGGTMCPSYMATREEKHSTRGRARMLFEMVRGDVIRDGWRSKEVFEALDLCLSCKGCKSECPVNVDMATYKAEFLSHYYAGRVRPLHAYAFGLIMYWSRLAAISPRLANFFTQTPLLAAAAKAVIGVAPRGRLPPFANATFQDRVRGRPSAPDRSAPQVVLWPDTFNNYFHPETGLAAVEVLEAAGFRVTVPQGFMCCGRPLYDYGMLDLAKHRLRATMKRLRPWIRAGVPIVGLEPSCVSVFRDELLNLFPENKDAKRLQQQVLLLSEFLERKAPHMTWPKLARQALVHGHCHQKSVMSMADEQRLLEKLGIELEMPDSGCCGMAGALGFERGAHYDVSMACGERRLLPAVRRSSDDTLLIADGFSCREQIAQATGRRAMHLAEALELALQQAGPLSGPSVREDVAAPVGRSAV